MFSPISNQPSPVTRTPRYDPDLDILKDPRDSSRFKCVYPCKDKWRARVMKRINLKNSFDTQLDAAKAVLDFFRKTFGDPDWKQSYKRRKVNHWRVKKVVKDGFTGYVADVFVDGNPIRVTLADTKRFTGVTVPYDKRKPIKGKRKWIKETEIYLWDTREQAKDAIERFKRVQLGILSAFRTWRG